MNIRASLDHRPIPLTILGGYLGAGKTTALNHLLRHAAGLRLAVVVNDFGSVNIDADLIETRDEQAISLAGGCVCCGFGDDLQDTLRTLRDAPQRFDHLLIETSGVALPSNLRATVSLMQGIRVAATIVLADAESVRQQADDRYVGDTVRAQLRAADLLVLTKGDLLDAPQREAVDTWARTQVSAPVLHAVMGAVPPEILLDLPTEAPLADATMQADRPGRGALAGAQTDAGAAVLRPPAHRTARFDAQHFEIDGPVDPQRLAQALSSITPPLARAKGLVQALDGQLHAVQVVGRRAASEPGPARANGAGRLVAISAGGPLDRTAVRAAIDAARAAETTPGPTRPA